MELTGAATLVLWQYCDRWGNLLIWTFISKPAKHISCFKIFRFADY